MWLTPEMIDTYLLKKDEAAHTFTYLASEKGPVGIAAGLLDSPLAKQLPGRLALQEKPLTETRLEFDDGARAAFIAASAVPDTPFWIACVAPKTEIHTGLAPWQLVAGMFLLSTVTIVGLVIMHMNNVRHLVLQRAHDELESIVEERTAELRKANDVLVQEMAERERAEAELEIAHRELVETARHVGMAEMATGVMHNVGNALNSVGVTTSFIEKVIRNSRVRFISNVAEMLKNHDHELDEFLAQDAKGRRIPEYLAKLSESLLQEREEIRTAVEKLASHVEHMVNIVNLQQSCGSMSGLIEPVHINDLIENALRLSGGPLGHDDVTVQRDDAVLPYALLDRTKALQILANLLSNARHALSATEKSDKRIVVRTSTPDPDVLRIEVSDNGQGIEKENLTRIFSFGFTTREDGHGFGLHSAALAAGEMGGSLKATSDGPGQGATFTLELPFRTVAKENPPFSEGTA